MSSSQSSTQQEQRSKALTKEVLIICVAVLVSNFPGYMVEPTFTLYALSIGASMTFIGLLGSVSSTFNVLTSIPFGRLSDKRGRKPFLLMWGATNSASHFIYALSKTFWHLIPGKMLMGLGNSASSVSFRSYLADVTPPSKLHVAMALFAVSMGIGVITGPLVGGRLVAAVGFEWTYLVASFIAVASILIVTFGVKERKLLQSSDVTDSKTSIIENLKTVLKNRGVVFVILLSSLNSLGYQVIVDYLPAYIAGLGFSAVAVGDLFFARGIFTAAVRFPIGIVAQRIGAWRLMIVAVVVQSVALIAVPFSGDYLFQSILMAIQGASFGIFLVTQATHIMLIAPSSARGVTLGVMGTVAGLLSITYGPIRGVIADIIGVREAFALMGAAIGIGTFAILLIDRATERRASA